MYMENSVCVNLKNKLTKSFVPRVGVRQGDNLSPNLFKILINDLPTKLNTNDDPVKLGDLSLSCLLYADDLVLFSETESGLQKCMNKLSDYCDKYCLTANLKKTKIIVFCKYNSKSVQTFMYKTHVIEQETSYKYLGIVFSSSGTFTNCQLDLYKRALKAYFKLLKSFGNIKPSVHTLIHLFDHTIKPILLHACEIWGTMNIYRCKFY